MMAIAASNATAQAKPSKPACKPRANYLKPKEICKTAQVTGFGILTCSAP
jgi:hypothetical protein